MRLNCVQQGQSISTGVSSSTFARRQHGFDTTRYGATLFENKLILIAQTHFLD